MNSLSNNEKYFISNSLDGIDVITENINSNALLIDGSNFMTADLDAGGHNVKNLANAVNIDEAVTLGQIQSLTLEDIPNGATRQALTTGTQTIEGIKTFTNTVNFNGATKTNLTLENIPDGATRQALTTGTQTISGDKGFTGTSTMNILVLNGANSNLSADQNVDASNKTGMYIRFGPSTTLNDFAYLRQIGGSNDIHMAFDFHDDAGDGKFSLRNVPSAPIPDGTPSTFFYSSPSDTTINSTILNVNSVLNLNGGIPPGTTDSEVDTANKANLYIRFGPSTTLNDFAYLRQIGGSNDIHMAFDFHDDAGDGKFSLRNVPSALIPDGTPSTFFYSSPSDTTISSTKLNVTGNAKITGQLDISSNINLQDNTSIFIGGVNGVQPYGLRLHYNTGAANVGVIDFSGTGLLIRKSVGGVAQNNLTIDNVYINTHLPINRLAWSSGELIQTRIINPSTLPVTSGVRNVSAGASLDWLFPSITLKNTPTNSIIVFSVDAPYFLSDFNKDQIELTIYDTTGGGASIVYRKTQYWEGSFGGGTRGSPILPLTFSHTPSIATTTLARTYTINIINRSNDTLYLCQGLVNTTITNMNYYTIELKEIKI